MFSFLKIQLKAFNRNFVLYMEELDHILFGWDTPMFIARLNSTEQNGTDTSIIYDQIDYVKKF